MHSKSSSEDEEWGSESAAMQGEARPATASPRGESAPAPAPAAGSARATPSPAPAPAPPPRLRLNASLATDPALQPLATALKQEPALSPPAPSPRDYLAALPPALSSAIAAGLFPVPVPDRQPAFVCQPCGIRYSSLSTLEAHKTYYCSHRPGKPTAGAESDDKSSTEATEDSESAAKAPKIGKQYACSQCSYSADKKVSLNRHMRIHSSSPSQSPAPTSNGDASPDGPPAQDRYCADCDIRFSSTKTFRAHKQHYCSTRQVMKQTRSSVTSGSTPPSPDRTPPSPAAHQPLLALPTNPILIVPYSLFRGASVLPGSTMVGLPDPEIPCFLLPNGTIQPMTGALNTASHLEQKENDVLKSKNRRSPRETVKDSSGPLDLSVRRTPEVISVVNTDSDEHEKENRIRRSTTPEQIVCAPSLPGSPGTMTPSPRRSSSPSAESISPKRKRRESRGATPKPTSATPPDDKMSPALLLRNTPTLIPPELALRLAAELPQAASSPQVLLKQGVSKCKECNIVFCKYENYVIHKKHYCSTRNDEERASPAPESGPHHYQQLICLACGIKFSSFDNLATHQSFYCLKRDTRSPRGAPEVPRVGPASAAGGAGGAGAEGGWKCPCCEVVSGTAAAAQRHMESHAAVKAFRCTICRYRGNTLRGMRTHIRMHFPKRPPDLQEESYIACVVEDESGRESASPSGGAVAVAAPGAAPGADKLHRCLHCDYTSTYRGNVVRHARLVHAAEEPEDEPHAPPAPAPVTPQHSPLDIKREPEDATDTPGPGPGPGPTYCKSCDISFKHVNTFNAHKQFYCSSHAAEHAQANNNLPAAAATAAAAARVTDAV